MKRKTLIIAFIAITGTVIVATVLGILLTGTKTTASILSVSLERQDGSALNLDNVPIGEELVLNVRYRSQSSSKAEREMNFTFEDSRGQQESIKKTLSETSAVARIGFKLLSGTGQPSSLKVVLKVKNGTTLRTSTRSITFTPRKQHGRVSFWAGGTNNTVLVDSRIHDWPGRNTASADKESESFLSLSVVTQGHCLFAGEHGTALIYRSGLNESQIRNISPPDVNAMSAISGVPRSAYYAQAAGLAYAAAEKSGAWDILKTTNIGETWSNLKLFSKLNIPSVKIGDVDSPTPEVVWAVGEKGLVARTDDGGLTWTKQAVPGNGFIRRIEAESGDTAWAVDQDGALFGTDDAGAAWSELQTPAGLDGVLAVSCAGSGCLWALGRNGNVARSDNAGESWTTSTPSGVEGLNAIAAADNERAFVVGNNLAIITTDDGGLSWRRVSDIGPDPNVSPEEAIAPEPGTDLLTVGVALVSSIEIEINSL